VGIGHFAHGIDQFAPHQVKRRLGINHRVVERVGQDLRRPYQAGLNVLQEEQLHGTKQQRADADEEPDLAHMAHESCAAGVCREYSKKGWVQPQQQRHQRPDGVQDHLAAQVVADLDAFLMFMRRAVDLIVSLWLEEEVTGLAADHGDQPADQGGLHRIKEHRNVGDDEADGAQQMQRLIDAAVVIVAMIVPALRLKFRQKTLHVDSLGLREPAMKQVS